MKKFATIINGEISGVIEVGAPISYEDGAVVDGNLIKEIPFGTDVNELILYSYWDGSAFQPRSARPGRYYDWGGVNWVLNEAALDTAVNVEAKRLLTASDWTQLDDTPPAKGPWAAYRAQVRAMTRGSATHMDDLVWPTPPS